MKILHISDTHGYHGLLNIDESVDMIIHSGDESNSRDPYNNEQESLNFLEWYSHLKIRYKIFVAGNHSTAIEKKFVTREQLEKKGIIYLENSSIEIPNGFEPIKIWGSPITPSFGEGWAFNKKRDKLHDLWQTIPEDTDIVITHGPPKGILDHSYNQHGNVYERCGCAALAKRIRQIEPQLCLFGHIHNTEDIINAGYTKLSDYRTTYSNGSVVTDGKFGKITSNGNIFSI